MLQECGLVGQGAVIGKDTETGLFEGRLEVQFRLRRDEAVMVTQRAADRAGDAGSGQVQWQETRRRSVPGHRQHMRVGAMGGEDFGEFRREVGGGQRGILVPHRLPGRAQARRQGVDPHQFSADQWRCHE